MRPSPANRGTAANMELENEMISSSSNSSAGSREYKVVMLGAGGVGKSAMTMQFISHRFPDYHDPTIEDAYKTQVRIDDEPAYLDILDTAGQAEFTAMRDQYMRGGEGFIICYSITDRQSFQEAAEFKELIYRVRHTYDIPLVLVGNKIDLEEFRQIISSAATDPWKLQFVNKSLSCVDLGWISMIQFLFWQ
ncbi:GTP-binding protein Rit2 isoform X4 [Tyto alba]|uniref:GTP-binding protein Rit2 isoform X4 n=1 Tax=Tyto alba TaxID=56313 RepID=UPI00140253FC|nr:GTP-binding protein Rit2 isoform X4 [Tyto alba]